ncbi:A-kinase anchor protein 1, mitochondrial [Lepeophtheirus salmonis]|nr:A-kinase anchor protein 1, mitochondrial-like [Lepeophtheirus salmonis]
MLGGLSERVRGISYQGLIGIRGIISWFPTRNLFLVTGVVLGGTAAYYSYQFFHLARPKRKADLSLEEEEDIILGEKEEMEMESSAWVQVLSADEKIPEGKAQILLKEEGEGSSCKDPEGRTSDVGGSSIGGEDEDEVGRTTEGLSSSSQCSDSGRGSEVDGDIPPPSSSDDFFAYHFYVPSRHCGRFIGSKGSNIKTLKTLSKCRIVLKDLYESATESSSSTKTLRNKKPNPLANPPQLCIIEGRRSAIEKCIGLIQSKFSLANDFTMEQVNLPGNSFWSNRCSPGLSLASEMTDNVSVCAIVSPAHVFVQLPSHPSYASLEQLNSCMSKCYEQLDTPTLLRPIEPGVICVARTTPEHDWWRVQVVSYDENMDICDIKFLDYGGFLTVHASQLRQIRTDYLSLPFQAIEVYLANLIPPKPQFEWPLDSGSQMEDILFYKDVKVNLLGVAEDGIPLVHLYTSESSSNNTDDGKEEDVNVTNEEDKDDKEINMNRELVERGIASWVELVPVDKQPTLA